MIHSLVCDMCEATKTTTDERFINAPHAWCEGGTWRDECLPDTPGTTDLNYPESRWYAKWDQPIEDAANS